MDGAGYCKGLSAERLSSASRVLAAADHLHALKQARPHRSALTLAAATDSLVAAAREGALDPRVVDALLAAPRSQERADRLVSLTDRERSVLLEVANGKTNKEIAAALGISARTVQTHTLNIFEKLGVSTRAAAAILASRAGLLAES